MDSENFEYIIKLFNQIDIKDEPGSEKYRIYIRSNTWDFDNKPKATLRYIPPPCIDFELYLRENCQNKIQILNRKKFHQIKQPIIIFFNHFREKCFHFTKILNEIYRLTLKYDDRIEFIAADILDIDILYPGRNPFNFISRKLKVEQQDTHIYAIDENKRIYRNSNDNKTLDTLQELCDNLLNGKLFPSLPLEENNKTDLIKICVDLNYKEMVLNSNNNIFLIVNLQQYQLQQPKLNYEKVAWAFRNYNLDFIYMEAEKNYIPFEYHIDECYPTLIYIPHNNKKNFIYYEGPLLEPDIIEFLQNIIDYPEILLLKQQQLANRMSIKTVQVTEDFQIDFHELPQFLQDNFDNTFKVLDRQLLLHSERYFYYFIIYMEFPNMKCLAKHIQWLNKISPVANRSFIYKFLIADFKDINIINTKWKPQDLINSAQGKPKIYAFDFLKHSYEFGNFDSTSKLFYFTASLESKHYYYSEKYSRSNIDQVVKQWTADYFNIFLKKTKKHTFITFYSSKDKNAEKLLNLLDLMAEEVKQLNVEVVKYDIEYNYVNLEYAQDKYPVHYFIPQHNKRDSRLFVNNDLSSVKILEFIKDNIE